MKGKVINMMKYLEKTLHFGLGLVTYSAEKIEQLVNELVKKGEVASEDAKNLINDLVEKGEKQRETIKNYIQEEVDKAEEKKAVKREFSVTKEEIRQMIKEELAKASGEADITDEDDDVVEQQDDIEEDEY